MTNITRLREIAEREAVRYLRNFSILDLEVIYRHGLTDAERAEVLRMIRTDARVPAPPQIIHTLTDLEALDPDTILVDSAGPYTAGAAVGAIYEDDYEDRDYLPAMIVAPGEQILAARQALETAK